MNNAVDSFSVALAAYNGEKYIRQQVDSILPQLREQDELIISYDDSTDRTLDIVLEYEKVDHRVKVIRNQSPGVVNNFNNAITNTKGNYIFISDQDDIWLPDKVKSIANAIRFSSAQLIIHNGLHTDENLNPVSNPFFTEHRVGKGLLRNFLVSRYSGCCMVFDKSLKNWILPIPSDIDAYDRWIGLLAEAVGKVEYVDSVLIHHRLHGANVTPKSPRSVITKVKSRVIMLQHLIKRLRKGNHHLK